MNLDRQQLFARLSACISMRRQTRRRPLKTVLPAAADYVLESRLMLSASSGGDTFTVLAVSVSTNPFKDTVENGAAVGNASTTGGNGNAITFYFEGGSPTDPSGTFTIDANTGVITVVNADNIGSQDGDYDSPTGWFFAATVVASDGQADSSATVSFFVEKSPFTIVKPKVDQEFKALTDDFKFEANRTKRVNVRVTILKKDAAGDYVKITNPNFTSEKEISGAGGKTTAEHNFGKAELGEYKVIYEYKKSGKWTDTGETATFKMVAP